MRSAAGATQVNYYERHLGDYAKQTGHLSMLQHGAYTLLLDRYYGSEKGIPAAKVYAVAKATSKPERAAVDSVLDEFFKLVDGLWIKNRCEEEIDRARLRVETARQNGRNGGRPKKQKQKPDGFSGGGDTETQHEPNGLSPEKPGGLFLGSQNETQQKALQSPVSSLQSPDPIDPLSRAPTEVDTRACEKKVGASTPTPEAAMAIPLREAGVKVTSIHPVLVAWVRDGFTLQQALGAVAVAREHKGDAPIAAAYLDTILRNPHVPKINGSGHAAAPPVKYRTADEIEAEEITRAITEGRTDDDIASDYRGTVSIDRIREIRAEVSRAQH